MPYTPADLSDTERSLIAAVQEGRIWNAQAARPKPEQLAEPAFVQNLPTIRASTIRSLCLGLWDDVRADPRGVQVQGARIVGEFDMSFANGQFQAVLLSCFVEQRLVVRHARLPALYLNGSYLSQGLAGDGLKIDGNLSFRFGFASTGELRLLGATIGGVVSFRGAVLDGNRAEALNADGMQVAGNLFFNDGFVSQGELRLLGVRVGGDVSFIGAALESKDKGKKALSADRMQVAGSLFCRDKFSVTGNVSLVGASIKGLLDWRPSNWTGVLNLSHASAGQWRDAWKKGTKTPPIILDHFSYGAFAAFAGMEVDAATRVAWIEAAQGDQFRPGAYQTLARVLRAAGDDRGAADVGLAKEKARAAHRAASYGGLRRRGYQLWMGFLDRTIGHGYRPWRGAGWLSVLLVAGWICFCWGAPTTVGGPGLIKPADPVFITQNHSGNATEYWRSLNEQAVLRRGHNISYALPVEYPPFSAFWYSLDTLFPLIDLGLERAWSPSPVGSVKDDTKGWALLVYLYFHIIMGWVLSTLTVVALTGLIKRDKEAE